MKFDWMRPAIPYLHAFIACAVLLWVTALAMDYIAVRRAALKPAKNYSPIDPNPLVKAEGEIRARAIEEIYARFDPAVQRIEKSIRDLDQKLIAASLPKPIPSPKERAIALCDELKGFISKWGPLPEVATNPGEDNQAWFARRILEHDKWRSTMAAEFRLTFSSRTRTLSDEIKIISRLPSSQFDQLDQAIKEAEASCDSEKVSTIRSELWNLAIKMN